MDVEQPILWKQITTVFRGRTVDGSYAVEGGKPWKWEPPTANRHRGLGAWMKSGSPVACCASWRWRERHKRKRPAAGAGVFKSCGLRPALGHTL